MNRDEQFPGSVLRVFEAHVKPGCADTLAKKFATTSAKVVDGQPGNQGHFLGKQVDGETEVMFFVSAWTGLDAIKSYFGKDWESSYLPPGYTDLIEAYSVKHIALQKDWPSLA